ncbi:hypothetical protein [Cetobacterium sp.]|uniref:hypothetical protein n=1 Tax=Cetobacterium sp. TaxID=2071632 RepID=UPI003EE66F11
MESGVIPADGGVDKEKEGFLPVCLINITYVYIIVLILNLRHIRSSDAVKAKGCKKSLKLNGI